MSFDELGLTFVSIENIGRLTNNQVFSVALHPRFDMLVADRVYLAASAG